jgi:hypothetical protein
MSRREAAPPCAAGAARQLVPGRILTESHLPRLYAASRFQHLDRFLAFAGDDARADIREFCAARLLTFAPFDFERHAKLPDGTTATVAFSLAFVQSGEMPRVAFFVSQNRAQDNFWKAEYQSHANGAAGIVAVYLLSPAPERDAAFVSNMLARARKSFSRRK